MVPLLSLYYKHYYYVVIFVTRRIKYFYYRLILLSCTWFLVGTRHWAMCQVDGRLKRCYISQAAVLFSFNVDSRLTLTHIKIDKDRWCSCGCMTVVPRVNGDASTDREWVACVRWGQRNHPSLHTKESEPNVFFLLFHLSRKAKILFHYLIYLFCLNIQFQSIQSIYIAL